MIKEITDTYDKIKAYAEEKGLRILDIEHQLGKYNGYLSKYGLKTHGHTKGIPLDILFKISKILNVPISEFIEDKPEVTNVIEANFNIRTSLRFKDFIKLTNDPVIIISIIDSNSEKDGIRVYIIENSVCYVSDLLSNPNSFHKYILELEIDEISATELDGDNVISINLKG